MAISTPRKSLLADWDDNDFSTAPPEDVRTATESDLEALLSGDPWSLVEQKFDDVVGAAPMGVDEANISGYQDEGRSKLYVGKEFTREQFAEWFSAQWLGSKPATGIGVHHTYRPDAGQFIGLQHIHNIFNYYATSLGWPSGKGPQIWIHGPSNRIFVGTHPASDGIGISYRNYRWLHIEWLHDGDAAAPSAQDYNLYAFVLKLLGKRLGIPLKHTSDNGGKGWDGKHTPHDGYLFHRNAKTNIKSCPGNRVQDRAFEDGIKRHAGGKSPSEPEAKPGILHKVQSGAFSRRQNADGLAGRLKSRGFSNYIVKEDGLHKVQLGAFSNIANARRLVAKVKGEGFQAIVKSGKDDDGQGGGEKMSKLEEGIQYVLGLVKHNQGYRLWQDGEDLRQPGFWGEDGAPPDYVTHTFCASVPNLAGRKVGVNPPRNGGIYNGGTRAYKLAYGSKMVPFKLSEFRRGDIAFVDFETYPRAPQGHVGVALGGADDPFLQSFPFPGSLNGLSKFYTLRQSHDGGYYTHRLPREVWLGS